MQSNLVMISEMIKKLGEGNLEGGLVHSAVEAFCTFCKRQLTKGKDWIRDLQLKDVLKEYYSSKGRDFQWKGLAKKKEDSKRNDKSLVMSQQMIGKEGFFIFEIN